MSEILTTYIEGLKKLERKQFDKILEQYPSLKPRYYQRVKEWIDADTKRSFNVKESMHRINDTIYDYMFTHMGFVREVGGFKIGDTFYLGADNIKIHTIIEFVVRPDGVFVIDNSFVNSTIMNYTMIEMISHQPKKTGLSYFAEAAKAKRIIDEVHMSTITSDISMFLEYYGRDNYDFNPVYQRDLVWTTKQKEEFIKAIMVGNAEVRPTFITPPHSHRASSKPFEVLDGKQRLNAIISFVRDEFSVDGYYFSDLNCADLSRFYRAPFIYTTVKYYSDKGWDVMSTKQKVELFLQINEYGQKVSDEHLEKIKKEYMND